MENKKRTPAKAIKKVVSDFIVENLPEIIEKVKKELNVETNKFEGVKVHSNNIDLIFQNNISKNPKECVFIKIEINSGVGSTFLSQEDKDKYIESMDFNF